MARNIVIKEDGIGKSMSASKLRTKLVDGGTCDWVPEDETRVIKKKFTENGTYIAAEEPIEEDELPVYGYSEVEIAVDTGEDDLEELNVTENGVYDSKEVDPPVFGYSKVTVNVPQGKLISKSITQNGSYSISSESDKTAYGYSNVSVNVPQGTLMAKTITENGTYSASQEESAPYGYSNVMVNVAKGTLRSKNITENGTYKASEEEGDVYGYSQVKVDVPASGTLKTKTITQNGTYRASDDESDGYSIVYVNVGLLLRIEVTTPPTKTSFISGENFDYSGIVVTGYYHNGTTRNVTEGCTFSPSTEDTAGEAGTVTVGVSYTEDGITAETSFDVSVVALLSIAITHPSNKLSFVAGENYDFTGLEVTAYYGDNTSEVVTEKCTLYPAHGDPAEYGVGPDDEDTGTVTNTISITYLIAHTSFDVQVTKNPNYIEAIKLMPTTFEDSLAKVRSVMTVPQAMLNKINSVRNSKFGGRTNNIVLAAGEVNEIGFGDYRFALIDIEPWVVRSPDEYLYRYDDPAEGLSKGVCIPVEQNKYYVAPEFIPHHYYWDGCSGMGSIWLCTSEGEVPKDEQGFAGFKADLVLGFGSDIFTYDPFNAHGTQPYQAFGANFLYMNVPDPNP